MEIDLTYRKGVGIVLINDDKKVFVGQRYDNISEAWQMPQGGIDEGEAPLDAAFRELEEEVGTRDASLIAQYPEVLKYDFPDEFINVVWNGKYKGQAQQWYLMQLNKDAQINIQTEMPEFRDWKWVEIEDLPNLIVPFKKELYEKLVEYFSPILNNL